MKWSHNLRTLQRGVKLASRIAQGRLNAPPVPPVQKFAGGGRLVEYSGFGDNPGRLRMRAYVPTVAASRPLVVVLHGCGQSAAGFAADSGWTGLADRLQFPLILPEQAEANNAGRCFQWFQPADTARGAGEAGSIAEMTREAVARFDSDPRRVFILGLSAGAAMSVAMLAAYPDLFAAGASVAGLPVGAARSGMQAIMRMVSAGPEQSAASWAAEVRAAAPANFAGAWPRLSIWQGEADTTVAPENARLLATQWRALHGLDAAPPMRTAPNALPGGVRHQAWPDRGQRQVELWSLPGLSHAYPAGARVVAPVPGRFVAPAPVDATAEIARFFGLD